MSAVAIAAAVPANGDAGAGSVADETLMLRYARGELAAFDALYARHRGGVWRYLLRGCGGDAQAAAELFQDVWANLVRAAPRYVPRAKFTTWLYQLAHHRLIDHWRAARVHEPLDSVPTLAVPEHEHPDTQTEAALQRRRLLAALQALPVEQREAFLLKEEGGLTLEEIAAATGVGRETVKSRLRYALVKLREGLADVL